MMPMRYGLTLTEQLLAQTFPDYQTRWPHGWEAGRLVIAPEYRVGQEVLRRCLFLGLEDLIDNVEVRHLLGSCTHILSRLYRRFGFSILASHVPLAGTEKHYNLIHGEVEDVLYALAPTGADKIYA